MSTAPLMIRAPRRLARQLHRTLDELYVRWHLRRSGVGGAGGIHTYTTRAELEALFRLAAACPPGARALEVGSHLGASTCYIGAGLAERGGQLYCVDTWGNETMPEGEQDTYGEFRRNTAGLDGRLTLIRKRSDQLRMEEVTVPLHLVFLDGDHSYESTRADFELTSPWVAEDGVLAFHDCLYFEGVSRVIGEALGSGSWVTAGNEGNLFWMKRAKWKR